jgi:hypothetical protein
MLEKRLAENRFLTSTVPELFRETCRDRPEKTAIVFEGREISYAELQSNADRCSQAVPVDKVILVRGHLRGPARDARIDGKSSQRCRVLRSPLRPARSSERRATGRALSE